MTAPDHPTTQSIPILLYHSVTEEVNAGFRTWSVTPRRFAEHIAHLHAEGYTSITVPQLRRCLDSQDSLPAKPVLITFDDGFADFLTNAVPVLERFSFSSTLYVPTCWVGRSSGWLKREGEENRPLLTWENLAYLAANNVEIGAHGHTHAQLDLLDEKRVRQEVSLSKAVAEEHLKRPITTFAYPHGYYTRRVRAMVIEAGYTSACAVKHAMSGPEDDPFALSRIMIQHDTDVHRLSTYLSGRGLRTEWGLRPVLRYGWRMQRRVLQVMHGHWDEANLHSL